VLLDVSLDWGCEARRQNLAYCTLTVPNRRRTFSRWRGFGLSEADQETWRVAT
jgi:hypothetical protein